MKGEMDFKIGVGVLTWNRSERISDRYGSCWLMKDSNNSEHWDNSQVKLNMPPEGQSGELIAKVIEPRESTHIGDFFRGLRPHTPSKGQVLILGKGKSFRVLSNGIMSVGCMPDDGRQNDWLDPKALYNCHESLVELLWRTKP